MVLNTTKNSPVIVLRVLEKKQSPDLAIRVKPGGMLSDSTLSKSKDVRWEFPIILWSFIHGFSMEIKEGNSTELTKEP